MNYKYIFTYNNVNCEINTNNDILNFLDRRSIGNSLDSFVLRNVTDKIREDGKIESNGQTALLSNVCPIILTKFLASKLPHLTLSCKNNS